VDNFLGLEENFDALIDDVRANENIDKLKIFLKKEMPKISKKHFNYTVLYMERALEVLCEFSELWELYIDFITTNNQDKKKLTILKRATRCCYNQVSLCIQLLKEMENQQISQDEIIGMFFIILDHINQSYNNTVDENFRYELWKYRLEYYTRNFNGTIESLELIRENFKGAISELTCNSIVI
jgi:hypothetical protein